MAARSGFLGSSRTLSALAFPNYRLLWIGGLISYTGDWMDQIAMNWLVLTMTGSPLYVGLLNFVRLVPVLALSLVGGTIADRTDRRLLALWTQVGGMVLAFALVALVVSPWLSLWPVLVLSALRGALLSFDRPARQALIPALVPREHLMNAVALHAALRNFTRILGPAIAGLLLGIIGTAGTIAINALSFVAVIVALLLMRVQARPATHRTGGVWNGMGEGLRYVRKEPVVLSILGLTLAPMIFGVPYSTLVPVFARDVLQVGPVGYGLLTSASGLGALLGAVWLAWQGSFSGRMLLATAFLFGAALVLFALSPWFGVSLVLLVLVGLTNQAFMTGANSWLQSLVPDELRGRVMAVYLMDRGLVPLGSIFAGGLAAVLGAPVTLSLMGAICAALTLAIALRVPSLRRLS